MYTEGSIKSCVAFEMSWDEICNLFEGIYINWNPSLFRYSLDFHGYVYVPCCLRVTYMTDVCLGFAPGSGRLIIRKTRGYVSPSSSVVYLRNRHFSVGSASNRHLRLTVESNDKSESIWVLLSRHQVARGRKSEYIALHVNDQGEQNMDITKIAAKVC